MRVARERHNISADTVAEGNARKRIDVDDIRYLLRYLNVTTVLEAMRIVRTYFDESQLQPKTRLALEELISA